MQKYLNGARTLRGDAIKNAQITVRNLAGALATIYSDNGITPQANPIITGRDGEYMFYAANGRYSISVTANGFVGESVSDVLLYDPSEAYTPIDATIADSAASAFASASNAATSAGTASTQAGIATDKAAEALASKNAAAGSATTALAVQVDLQANWGDKLATATNQAAASLGSAQASEVSRQASGVSAGLAATAKTGAESARDAAIIGAGVYVDEPTGRAAVADGVAFKVQGGGDVAAYEYRRTNSGASVLIASYPSANAVADVAETKAGMRRSINLFNPVAAADNFYIIESTGLPAANTDYAASAHIPVVVGQVYFLRVMARYAWYDASKVFLSGSNPGTTFYSGHVTAPAGAAYLRVSVRKLSVTVAAFDVVQTSGIPAFEPYGYVLNGSNAVALQTAALGGGAVTPAKTTFLVATKNLFDKSTATTGKFFGDTGTISDNATYAYSAYIDVTPGQVWKGQGAANGFRSIIAFDANSTILLGAGASVAGSSYTVPAEVKRIRINIYVVDLDSFQWELGAVATTYAAYGWTVDNRVQIPSTYVAPRPPSYGLERLRETRWRLRSLAMGDTSLYARLSISIIGDSYSHKTARWALKFATALWSKYHAGVQAPIGRGFTSFSTASSAGDYGSLANGNILVNDALVRTGTWTITYATGGGPDICQAASSEAAASFTLPCDYSLAPVRAYALIAQGGAGVVRYRWTDAGGWTSIDLSAIAYGMQSVALTGQPASGAGNLKIEVVSGSVVLYGLAEMAAAAGVLINKIAATGSSALQWASMLSEVRYTAAHAALDTNLVIIMHGANDQTSQTKAQFKSSLLTIIDRMRVARPKCDVLLVAQPENLLGQAQAMSEYADAMYEIARDLRDVAYTDLQPAFGVAPADYDNASARPLFASDDLHPLEATGGYVIADAVLGAIHER